jgi:hypothetical protein
MRIVTSGEDWSFINYFITYDHGDPEEAGRGRLRVEMLPSAQPGELGKYSVPPPRMNFTTVIDDPFDEA